MDRNQAIEIHRFALGFAMALDWTGLDGGIWEERAWVQEQDTWDSRMRKEQGALFPWAETRVQDRTGSASIVGHYTGALLYLL